MGGAVWGQRDGERRRGWGRWGHTDGFCFCGGGGGGRVCRGEEEEVGLEFGRVSRGRGEGGRVVFGGGRGFRCFVVRFTRRGGYSGGAPGSLVFYVGGGARGGEGRDRRAGLGFGGWRGGGGGGGGVGAVGLGVKAMPSGRAGGVRRWAAGSDIGRQGRERGVRLRNGEGGRAGGRGFVFFGVFLFLCGPASFLRRGSGDGGVGKGGEWEGGCFVRGSRYQGVVSAGGGRDLSSTRL